MSDVYLGSIIAVAFNFAPRGYAFCNGQILSIQQNTALFALLGATYGGNGQTTFALPNLQGRSIVHPGSGAGLSPVTLGQVGGANSVTLNTTNLPSHVHTFAQNVSSAGADQTSPVGGVPAVPATTVGRGVTPTYGYTQTAATGTMPAQITGSAGNGVAVATQSPFLGINYCIALQGIFPSRN